MCISDNRTPSHTTVDTGREGECLHQVCPAFLCAVFLFLPVPWRNSNHKKHKVNLIGMF